MFVDSICSKIEDSPILLGRRSKGSWPLNINILPWFYHFLFSNTWRKLTANLLTHIPLFQILYKGAWEGTNAYGCTLHRRYIPIVGAKHANYVNSEVSGGFSSVHLRVFSGELVQKSQRFSTKLCLLHSLNTKRHMRSRRATTWLEKKSVSSLVWSSAWISKRRGVQ